MVDGEPLSFIGAEEYHAGDEGQPRLSASIAHILCTTSPLHAWTAHPRLNPHYERKEEERFDVGKAAHSVLLEGEDNIYVVHEDSWRKTVAKEARDYARSLGKVPLLAANRDEVLAMADAVREQLVAHEAEPPLFSDGKPEVSILWEEGGVLCKARFDWLRDDRLAIDDLKTTSRSASPNQFSRNLFSTGADIQAAMYLRAVRSVLVTEADLWGLPLPEPVFRWVVVETTPPYAISVITPGPDVLALGDAKVAWALEEWSRCLAANSWPAYPPRIATAELPPWEESKWLEREVSA
jgi:hypothetical protein